jgi:hypothetical protein
VTTYRPRSRDPRPEIEALIIEAYRCMSPSEKLQRVAELNRMRDELLLVGIRSRYPGIGDGEARLRLA